jgi:hypothetical protein
MRTAGGVFGGWISSTVSSSLLVMVPRANVMRDDAVTAGSDPVEALGSGANANQGRPTRHLELRCRDSDITNPELLDSEKHIHLKMNATCSGATTSEVTKMELSALTPGVELVTLTVGGNDLGFAGLAGTCATPGMQVQCIAAIKEQSAFCQTSAAISRTCMATVFNIVYVDVTRPFLGHGIGSTDPFINRPTPVYPV